MPRRQLLALAAALSMVAASALPVMAQDERPHGAPSATPNPVPLDAPAGDGTAVRLTTELGDIVIGLFNESAPVAAENFLNLANEGFYDGVGFHRAVPGFVLQGGDPNGDGTGGPDYRIQDEDVVGQYGRGIVAMARTPAPNSQGSQFFIVLDDAAEASLEPARTYTIFGRVVEGMDVVDEIVSAREPSNLIEDPVRIESISVEQVELPPEPTPRPTEPPTAAELAAEELAAMLPDTAGGFELQTGVFTFADVLDQLDPDIVAELQALADANGADLELLTIGQAGGGSPDDFVNLAAFSVPGLPAEEMQDAVSRLLLPDTDLSTAAEESYGDRTVQVVDLGGGQTAYILPSDDIVWFVVTTLDDVEPIISDLP